MPNRDDARDKPVQFVRDSIMEEGVEGFGKRFYAIYRGIVLNNADPENRGRCVIQIPSLGHDEPSKVQDDFWARPSMTGLSVGDGQMHGCFFPPDVNDEVWVQFENGDPAYPVYTGGFMKLEYEGEDLIAENALYKGIRTKSGHYLRFSDDVENDDLHITIAKGDGEGGVSGSTISLTKNGSLLAANDKNTNMFLDNEKNTATLMASDGTKMLSSIMAGDDKVVMMTKSGGSISIDKDVFQFNGKDFIINAGGKIALLSGKVFVGDSKMYEPAIRGLKLNIWALAHQHTTTFPGAPTAPFAPPPGLLPFNELSEIVSIA